MFDDILNLVQELLQRQFPNTRGLYACVTAVTLQPSNEAFFLKVVNRFTSLHFHSVVEYSRSGGSHWLLMSSYGAERGGQLFDSLFDSFSASTAELVCQLQELQEPRLAP